MNPSRPCLSKMKKNKLFSITRNTKMTRFLTKLGCQNQPQDTSSHLRARTYRSPPGRTESPAARTEGFLDVQIAPLDVQRASWTYKATPRDPRRTEGLLDVQTAPLDVQRAPGRPGRTESAPGRTEDHLPGRTESASGRTEADKSYFGCQHQQK